MLDEDNKFGHKDGFARLGAGMTWGTSKFGNPGVHQYARDAGRVVVSGHAGNVGVVGWSLGGGHGQLVGVHGLGVDQVLEVNKSKQGLVSLNFYQTRLKWCCQMAV